MDLRSKIRIPLQKYVRKGGTIHHQELIDEWKSLKEEIPKIEGISWKDIIKELTHSNDDLKTRLVKFRIDLNKHLLSICNDTSVRCNSYGNTSVESDIDVTISGINILTNSTKLKLVIGELRRIIQGLSLCSIHKFFDINYYLSDFGLKKDNNNDSLCYISDLDSYYLSNEYIKQFRYALSPAPAASHAATHAADQECNDSTVKYDAAIAKLQKELNIKDDANSNAIVDYIYQISTYEHECYHTQGAFFHVVLMMQRGIQFSIESILKNKEIYINMLKASYIENMFFAQSHVENRSKYIKRVNDAFRKLISIISTEKCTSNPIINPFTFIEHTTVGSTIIDEKIKQLKEYIDTLEKNEKHGGSGDKLKVLTNKSTGQSIKKNIYNRDRLIYVDSQRYQYVKIKNVYHKISTIK